MNYSNGRMWDEYDRAMSRITALEDDLEKATARAEAAEARAEKLQAALHDIYEACYAADCDGELDYRIDGDILDAARLALKGGEG